MPNRYLRSGYPSSERINRLTAEEERLWARLLTHVDDFGRCEADPLIILGTLFIRQIETVTVARITEWLAGMDAKGVIALYTVNGRQYVQYDNWECGRATESKYPQPPADACRRIRMRTAVSRRKQTHTDADGRVQTHTDADGRVQTQADAYRCMQPHSTSTSTSTSTTKSTSTSNRSRRVSHTIHDYDAIHACPDPLAVAAELTGDHSLKGRQAFRRQMERIGQKAYIDVCCEYFGESKTARFNNPAAVLMAKLKKHKPLTTVNNG